MKTKFTALSIFFLLALLVGCQKKESGGVSIKTRSESLTPEAGSTFVSVSATLDWTISLEFPDGGSWATIEPASGTGSKSDILLKYEANTSEGDRTVVLVLNGMGAEDRTSLLQYGKGGGAQGQYGYDTLPSELDWLEMPAAVAGDGREVLIHDMTGGKYKSRSISGIRNWSCYWDFDDHLSLWVAYPLNRGLIGSGSRTDQWGVYDPCIPSSMQPNMGVTYGGGWTRGHQIPSADRYTRAANISTFYPTNMTPQDYNFNSGIWVDLENKVRNYANSCDTLYVVTGALFDSSTRRSGSNSGFAVKVPTHYFKALLAHTTGGTQGVEGYLAAGFIFPHESSIANGNFLSYIGSIDKLETETGIDFFPNLARKIGKDKADAVEAATPGNWWK